MEQKIINQNQLIHKNIALRAGTPNMFDDDVPIVQRKNPVIMSFISQDMNHSKKNNHLEDSEDENNKKLYWNKNKIFDLAGENQSNGKNKTQDINGKRKVNKKSQEKNMPFGHMKDKLSQKPSLLDSKMQKSEEKPHKEGFLEKYFSKVLKNLTLTIKNIHIRYEDEVYSYQNPFAIGFSLSKIEVKNVNQE